MLAIDLQSGFSCMKATQYGAFRVTALIESKWLLRNPENGTGSPKR
jgi:hypothetical protein